MRVEPVVPAGKRGKRKEEVAPRAHKDGKQGTRGGGIAGKVSHRWVTTSVGACPCRNITSTQQGSLGMVGLGEASWAKGRLNYKNKQTNQANA